MTPESIEKLKKLKSILNPEGMRDEKLGDMGSNIKEIKEKVGGDDMNKAFTSGDFISGFLKSIKGDKGDKGDSPVKGTDYFTEEELSEITKKATPILGKDYLTEQDIKDLLELVTPRKGEHYFTEEEVKNFIKKVTPVKGVDYRDGKDSGIDEDEIVEKVIEKIPKPKDGEDGKNPDPKDVIEKIKNLKGKEAEEFSKAMGAKLDISNIKNASTFIFNKNKYKIEELMRGGTQITVSGTAPTAPLVNQLWVDIS